MNVWEQVKERYELSIERIRTIAREETVDVTYREYFYKVAEFILFIDQVKNRLEVKSQETCTLEALQSENQKLYEDILEEQYEVSYANPTYAVEKLGDEIGQFLSALYTEIRSEIAYVYEGKLEYLAICNELFVEVYNCFEETATPEYKSLKDILYWYASDYCDVFVADRIKEQVDSNYTFATDIIMQSDLSDVRYLYRYGEYISRNEIRTAEYLNSLSEETIDRMAEVYTEGYRVGFEVAGIDLSKKKTVNLHYNVGFERMMRKAIENFRAIGLEPTVFREAVSVLTRKGSRRNGFGSVGANKQYLYDHRADQALFFDKKFVERKLDVMKNAFEEVKDLAGVHAGPAVVEVFGEEPFAPIQKEEALRLSEKQEKLSVL